MTLSIRSFDDFKQFVSKSKNIKRCIIRCDLNLPSEIEDLTRVRAIKATVIQVLNLGLNIVLISHYKRPRIEDIVNSRYSLSNIVSKISEVLGVDVCFIKNSIFDIDPSSVNSKITLLENLRFYEGETKDEEELAERLSRFGDVYINDAFSVSHRKHASVHAIAKHMPAFAGILLQREIDGISMATSEIKRPFTAIIGGSKVSSKIDVLKKISQTADYLIITGAMANTFLSANGIDLKNSMIEQNQFDNAIEIMKNSKAEIILPVDFMASENINTNGSNYDNDSIPNGFSCFDIGEKTIEHIKKILDKTKTLLWNGALGAFEFANFDNSSKEISKYIANKTQNNGLFSVIGGGETVASLGEYSKDMTFVSTAGGAFLEFVAGVELPGLAALQY